MQSHQEPIEALRVEGNELKTQGTPEDGKKVDHWVDDLAQRWDELGGAIDDRQVHLDTFCMCSSMYTCMYIHLHI